MNNDFPLISIFTVVKNAANSIDRCIESVLAIDYPNVEHVIQDGASTDGTLEILEKYAQKHPDRVRYASEPDTCSEEGFFRGLKNCRGKWIGTCLADETLLRGAGKWVQAAFTQHPSAGAVYGDLYVTDAHGNIQSEFQAPHPFTTLRYLLHEVNPPFASSFFSRQALERVGLHSHPWVWGLGEFEMWVRIGLKYPVEYVAGLVATYAIHSGQLSASKRILLKNVATRVTYLKDLFARPDIQAKYGSHYSEVVGGMHLFFAEVVRDNGHYQEAAGLLRKALTFRTNSEPLKRLLGGFYSHGLAAYRKGRMEDAIVCWEPLAELGISIPELAGIRKHPAIVPLPGRTNGTPLASVIVLCHNYQAQLPIAVESVLVQTCRDFELILIDDGSTDESLRIAQELASKHAGQTAIRVFHLEDVGPSAARRFGIAQARGRYFVPLDADDRIAPAFLERTLPVMEADEKLGFAYVDPVYFGDQDRRYQMPEYDLDRLVCENFISYCSLVRKSAFEAVDGYDRANWGYYEDWDLWIRLGKAGWRGRHVPEPLFFYHQHFSSSLTAFAKRLDPIYRAYVLAQHPDWHSEATLAEARALLAEMPAGWHARPPMRDLGVIESLLQQHSGNRHLLYFRALAQWKADRKDPAVASLQELLRAHPEDALARDLLTQWVGKSMAAGSSPGDGDPTLDVAAVKARAQQAFNQQKWSEVAETCAQWVMKAPNDTEALFLFTHALANLGMLPEALNVARRLIALVPHEQEYVNLVAILEKAVRENANDSGSLPAGEERLADGPTPDARQNASPLEGKRVLIYTDDPGQGGAAHYNHAILLGLIEQGAQAYCAQPKGDGQLPVEQAKAGVKHVWTAYNPVVEFGRSFVDDGDAKRIFDEALPDVIYFSDCCAVSHLAAKKVAIERGIPYVVICHSEATYLAERFAQYLPIVKAQLAQARGVIAVSKSSLGVLRKFFGLAADKGQVIYSGCSEAFFAPTDPAVRRRLRAELALPGNAVVGFSAARLDHGKCHQLQLEAMRRLRDQGRLGSLHLVWAGDGELRQQLTQAVAAFNLQDRVHLLGYRWDVRDWMGASDAFVLTTLHEALPLCLIEAMARGLPVIASAVGGIPEELGDTGVLLPDPNADHQKTVARLMEVLVELDTQPDRRRALGATGKRRAEAMFQRGRMVADTLDVLTRALQSTTARPTTATEEASTDGEFFGAEEVATIESLAKSYAERPTAEDVRTPLVELQQGLVNFLVTADRSQLEGHFKGSLGQVFRSIVRSGLALEPTLPHAEEQTTILDEAAAAAQAAGDGDYRPWLARMLVAPAHRGCFEFHPEKIPQWLRDDFLAYVYFAPSVFVMAGEAEVYADYLLKQARDVVRRIRQAPCEAITDEVAGYFALKANFIPLYLSGRNTRELAEHRGAIMEFVLAKHGAAFDYVAPKRPKQRTKIRIGFLNGHFGAQTETHVTLPTLQLDRHRFEICLFAVNNNPGAVQDHCRSFADTFTVLPKGLHEQVAAIRNARLDVIVIGTNISAVTNQISLLALHRLAPLQLVSYCSPCSTGLRHMDGYLNGTLVEFPGMQNHYSEKLLLTEGPPGCLDYTVEAKATRSFSRAELGLKPDDVVFINAASCFKILPEMQETWAKILAKVPKAKLVLLPFNPNWATVFPVRQFEAVLNHTLAKQGVGPDRVIMAASLPNRAEVKELEKVADVYLDTFPFSGSISVIDPLELGTPCVVWEGQTPRSRMSAVLLRELQIPELIVQTEEAYIALATRLATEPDYRADLQRRILAAMACRPRFVNPAAYAEGLGRAIERAVQPAGVHAVA